ncbi:hypothetical protein SELMODRAFT_428348 [Selaginella moellendorffii]|uniref:Uncharacterized protein n=1 Tax=Selaginella moellendorffii TaxID=88036 RepID=D8T2J7_SELML|nr:hypothetical protein SELMODRAFT_428348 [Selaginella moellendorffii]
MLPPSPPAFIFTHMQGCLKHLERLEVNVEGLATEEATAEEIADVELLEDDPMSRQKRLSLVMLLQHSGARFKLVVNHKFKALAVVRLLQLEIVSVVQHGKCKECGVAITNTPYMLTNKMANLAMVLLLGTMQSTCPADCYVCKGLWPIHGDFPLSHKNPLPSHA